MRLSDRKKYFFTWQDNLLQSIFFRSVNDWKDSQEVLIFFMQSIMCNVRHAKVFIIFSQQHQENHSDADNDEDSY